MAHNAMMTLVMIGVPIGTTAVLPFEWQRRHRQPGPLRASELPAVADQRLHAQGVTSDVAARRGAARQPIAISREVAPCLRFSPGRSSSSFSGTW
jgi:hypothetical protein